MAHPISSNLDLMRSDIYDELYLDYFFERTKIAFPSIYNENVQHQILIRLMAWAVARSYQQPLILKYLYNTDLVMDDLLPRLADTLGFTYPLEYPVDQLRVLIKYLQRIRRSRGTLNSIKQLVRLLNIAEDEVLNLSFLDYSSVVIEEPYKGFLLIHYNRIQDYDFANSMLSLVMPAGYSWRLESSLETLNQSIVYRNRVELINFDEYLSREGDSTQYDKFQCKEFLSVIKWEGGLEDGSV